MGERIAILNPLRALAAVMVCLYHAAFILGDELPDWFRILDWGQEGVYVFFVISGLVMPLALDKMKYQTSDFANFILKRIIRLQPPLILSAAVMTFMSYQTLKQLEFSPITLFLGSASLTAPIFGIPFVNDIYWTLFVEMQFYIYIALFFPLLVTHRPVIRWIFTLLLLALSFLSLVVDDKWMKLLLPFHLPVFLMGYFLFLLKTFRIKKLEFIAGLGVCALSCILLTGYCHSLGYRIPLVAALTTLMIAFGQNSWNGLSRIGEYSYSLYLFHWLFISLIAHYARPYFTGKLGAMTLYIIIIVVCVVSSRIFYVMIERPSLYWAKKFGDRKLTCR